VFAGDQACHGHRKNYVDPGRQGQQSLTRRRCEQAAGRAGAFLVLSGHARQNQRFSPERAGFAAKRSRRPSLCSLYPGSAPSRQNTMSRISKEKRTHVILVVIVTLAVAAGLWSTLIRAQ